MRIGRYKFEQIKPPFFYADDFAPIWFFKEHLDLDTGHLISSDTITITTTTIIISPPCASVFLLYITGIVLLVLPTHKKKAKRKGKSCE